jgi:hypothetical protein
VDWKEGVMLRSFGVAALLFPFAGAVMVLGGCGNGLATQSPSGTTSATGDTRLSRSWMNPMAKKENLIYVSTSPYQGIPVVEVYSWGKRERIGDLRDAANPRFLCSDKTGDVFVPDSGTSQIFEYAHGGTSPIAVLKDTDYSPRACSSDAVTGDLAVVDYDAKGYGIAIYQNASGTPIRHSDERFKTLAFCGYDATGNLFVDGISNSPTLFTDFILAEFPKGGKSFTEIKLEPANFIPHRPGSVQWDGRYMAVGDAGDNTALQYRITGSTGTHQGTAYLDLGEGLVHQFWIPKFGDRVLTAHIVGAQFLVGARHDFGDIGFWNYPNGGYPNHLLVGPDHPLGITVSVASK